MDKKKIAVITGGSSGIGKAIGEKLLKQDYEVINADINATSGKKPHPPSPLRCDQRQ